MSKYTSNAEWPETITVGNIEGYNVSTDIHDSKEAAIAICKKLMREGFGGEGKIFPIRTWIDCSDEDYI